MKESVTKIIPENNLNSIEIKGARVHNLKNVDLNLPRDKFIVITGLSGSGKSSLAFDTIYAEGQRRYVESLSSYARQFLGRMQKPEVDFIKGIPPAIAIEQKVNTRNPRSTVGTSTELYDYLKLLYARIGKTYSPVSGQEVTKDSVSSIVDFITSFDEGTKFMILCPAATSRNIAIKDKLNADLNEGFSRIEVNGKTYKIDDVLNDNNLLSQPENVNLIIDRLMVKKDEDSLTRTADSVLQALKEGNGYCSLLFITAKDQKRFYFSERYDADGIEFEEPTVHMFSFNNPLGACPRCEGYGKVIGIDEDLVIPDKSLSVYDEAVVAWKGEKMQEWKNKVIRSADKVGFPIHKPYYELSEEQKDMLWKGSRYFRGLHDFFNHLEEKKYKIQYRVMLSRYRGKTKCPECNGRRLKKEAGYVKVNGKSIMELVTVPISDLNAYFEDLSLSEHETQVSKRILIEIRNRLRYMVDVGLGYLTLNRLSSTLSGGESQRINLATSLGSSLVGSLYILDEPSIGLHPRDTNRLISVLKNLRELGNTLLVVEHDEEIIRAADLLVDIGPEAGRLGGEVVFQGNHQDLVTKKNLTAKYLNGEMQIDIPVIRRKWNNYVEIIGARENNLKNIKVKLPLNVLTVITGVSGSGKSTLVKSILYPALNKIINGYGEKTGEHDAIKGDYNTIDNVEFVDQNPIGKSSRSNPVTYLKAYDEIRKLFAQQQAATINNLKPSHFSFNIDGGRCEECQGEGEIKVEMQFMADVHLVCESCSGKRFKDDVLEVKYHGKNIHDVLEMTIREALDFFGKNENGSLDKKIVNKLSPLDEVGLGYVKLGQSSSTLSGGESQRVKLASFLGKDILSQHQLFIFDEPTTGLHFHDIKKLLAAFNALIEKGNSIIIIEHNLEVIKCADWIVDLGPEGGEKGGEIVYEGIPEDIVKEKTSHTGRFLKEKLM